MPIHLMWLISIILLLFYFYCIIVILGKGGDMIKALQVYSALCMLKTVLNNVSYGG